MLVTLIAVSFTLVGSTRPPQDVATWVGIGQSVSNLVAAVLGLWLLQRRLGPLRLGRVVQQNVRLIIATIAATACGWLVLRGLDHVLDTQTWVGAVLVTTIVSLVVLAISLGLAARLRVREVTELLAPWAADWGAADAPPAGLPACARSWT